MIKVSGVCVCEYVSPYVWSRDFSFDAIFNIFFPIVLGSMNLNGDGMYSFFACMCSLWSTDPK